LSTLDDTKEIDKILKRRERLRVCNVCSKSFQSSREWGNTRI